MILAYAFTSVGNTAFCDGCADCAAAFQVADEVKLTQDITINGTCLDLIVSNKTFDCQGHWIKGNGSGYGIRVRGNYTNITGCKLSGFEYPLTFSPNHHGVLTNSLVENSTYGVFLNYSNYTYIFNVSAHHNTRGFDLRTGSYNTVVNITTYDNYPYHGLWIYFGATHNRLINITTHHNIACFSFNKAFNNTLQHLISHDCIDGLYYLNSAENNASDIYTYHHNNNGIIIHKSSRILLQNIHAVDNGIGLFIFRASSHDNYVHNITTEDNLEAGIRIEEFAARNIIENWTSNNDAIGLILFNEVTDNKIDGLIANTPTAISAHAGPNEFNITVRNASLAADLWAPANASLHLINSTIGAALHSDGNVIALNATTTRYPVRPYHGFCKNTVNGLVDGQPLIFINSSGNYRGSWSEVIVCNASHSNISGNLSAGGFILDSTNVSLKLAGKGPLIVEHSLVSLHDSTFVNAGPFFNHTPCPAAITNVSINGLPFGYMPMPGTFGGVLICGGVNSSYGPLNISTTGLYILNSQHINLTNVRMINTTDGVFIQNSTDVRFINSTLDQDVHIDDDLCGYWFDNTLLNNQTIIAGDWVPPGVYSKVILCNARDRVFTDIIANEMDIINGQNLSLNNLEINRTVVLDSKASISQSRLRQISTEDSNLSVTNSRIAGATVCVKAKHTQLTLNHTNISACDTGVLIEDINASLVEASHITATKTAFHMVNVSGITIAHNVFSGGRTGFTLDSCGESGPYFIYDNVFNSTRPTYMVGGTEYDGYWNTTRQPGTNIIGGPYLGGNWYSDYSPTCPDKNSDGICDEPYYITRHGGNTDYLPLARFIVVGHTPCRPYSSFYTSIGAAVNHALPHDIIWICPGQYNEYDIVIDKPLVIYGNGAILWIGNHEGILLKNAQGVNISNLTIVGEYSGEYSTAKAAIRLEDSQNNRFDNISIINASVGLWLYNDADNNWFNNISIRAYSYGVVVDNYGESSDQNTFVNLTIHMPDDNRVMGGLYIFDSSHNIFRESVINTSVRSVYVQSYSEGSYYNRFVNTTVYGDIQLDPNYRARNFPATFYTTGFDQVWLNNRPVFMYQNQTDVVIRSDGKVFLYNITNSTLIGPSGVSIGYSQNVSIVNATINGFNGIEIWNSAGYIAVNHSRIETTASDGIVSFGAGPAEVSLNDVVFMQIGRANYYTARGGGNAIRVGAPISGRNVRFENVLGRNVIADGTLDRVHSAYKQGKMYFDGDLLLGHLWMFGQWLVKAKKVYGIAINTNYGAGINYSGGGHACVYLGDDYRAVFFNASTSKAVDSQYMNGMQCVFYPTGAFYVRFFKERRTRPSLYIEYLDKRVHITDDYGPVQGAHITMANENQSVYIGETNESGWLTVRPPYSGHWTIHAEKDGYREAELTVYIAIPSGESTAQNQSASRREGKSELNETEPSLPASNHSTIPSNRSKTNMSTVPPYRPPTPPRVYGPSAPAAQPAKPKPSGSCVPLLVILPLMAAFLKH